MKFFALIAVATAQYDPDYYCGVFSCVDGEVCATTTISATDETHDLYIADDDELIKSFFPVEVCSTLDECN